jgi:hypothetical protein
MVAARQAGDEQAGLDLAGEWRSRLRRLAAADEHARDELRRLVEAFRPLVPAATAGQGGSVVMQAAGSGRSRVYQAGRDQTITNG